jgi:hypothetical protein
MHIKYWNESQLSTKWSYDDTADGLRLAESDIVNIVSKETMGPYERWIINWCHHKPRDQGKYGPFQIPEICHIFEDVTMKFILRLCSEF